jgi:hypothetical protein
MQHFVEAERAGEKTDPAGGVIGFSLRGAAEYQNGNLGEAGVEFGDERGAADSGHLEARDDEAKISGKLGLLDQAEGLGCIANALDVVETPFEEGLAQERLEWIVVH